MDEYNFPEEIENKIITDFEKELDKLGISLKTENNEIKSFYSLTEELNKTWVKQIKDKIYEEVYNK